MNYSRCGDKGATRWEIHLQGGAKVSTYLCQDCTDAERDLDEVKKLVSTQGQ